MSRAFTKEEDAQEQPIIPPRAALPPGTPNYVTPAGLELLREELTDLEAARAKAETNRENETDRTRSLSIFNGRISALTARIASAKVIEPKNQPQDEVRFGATITLKTKTGGKPGIVRKFTIVGVDEASVPEGKIAFNAPIAQAVQGAKKGDIITLQLGRNSEEVEVAEILYSGSDKV